jgi:hypothetical protein
MCQQSVAEPGAFQSRPNRRQRSSFVADGQIRRMDQKGEWEDEKLWKESTEEIS